MSDSPSDPSDSPTDAPTPNPAPVADVGSPSPLPGCIILITVILVFGSLLTWFAFSFRAQSEAIATFTVESAVETPRFEPSREQIESADAKLTKLAAAADAGEMTRLLFTAEDLNTLIATRELLADFRGQTFVRSISAEGIEAEMTQSIRTGFLNKGSRYLHGTFWLKPGIAGGTVVFAVADIKVPGREVPQGFVTNYPAFMKIDPKLAPFDRVLPKLGKVYVEGAAVVVETKAAESNR